MNRKITLRDFGNLYSPANGTVKVLDTEFKDLCETVNPFRKVNQSAMPVVAPYLDRTVVGFDTEIDEDTKEVKLKVYVESFALQHIIDKVTTAERGHRFELVVYKSGKLLFESLLFINGKFNIENYPDLVEFRLDEVKKTEKGYTEQGYRKLSFYI